MIPDTTPWEFDDDARLDSLIVAACRRYGGDLALIGEGVTLSYDRLLSRAQETAATLVTAGIGPGTAVAVVVANQPGDVVAQLAVWLAGATVVPLHHTLPPVSVRRVLRRSGARWIVAHDDAFLRDWIPRHAPATRPVSAGMHAVEADGDGTHGIAPDDDGTHVVTLDDEGTHAVALEGDGTHVSTLDHEGTHAVALDDDRTQGIVPDGDGTTGTTAADGEGVPVAVGADTAVVAVRKDTALVAFSSGSTGEPKAIEISHAAFANKLLALQTVFGFQRGQRALHVLQLNFTFGQWTSLLTLLTGGVVEMTPSFSPNRTHARLRRGDIDRVAVVPTMLRMLLRVGEANGDTATADRAGAGPGLWIAGGEPLSAGLGRSVLHSYPGSSLTDVYGLSETSTSDLILRAEDYADGAGTIGTPSPGVECRVDAAPGEAGEIRIRTPFLMSGYLGRDEATREAVPDGWFRTGDLGRIRPDGRVELVGRAKNMISRGAVKVSPLEIESAYAANPAWTDCLAVGVTDEVLGERIHLLVAPHAPSANPGPDATSADIGELRRWGEQHLERGKNPDAFHLVDEIPRGETGKADRRAAALLASEMSRT